MPGGSILLSQGFFWLIAVGMTETGLPPIAGPAPAVRDAGNVAESAGILPQNGQEVIRMEKRYDFHEVEKRLRKEWADRGVYRFDPDSDREIYSIDTPPPTVSGSLHIGHIFSYAQAEMIARFHRMQGRNVFYPFGFDDNGLPTERLVEREQGILAHQLDRSEFIARCMETTEKYEAEFMELWQSLGFSVDWSLSYRTISPDSMRISQESFIDLARRGKAYLKETPVLWCTTCRTSISQAELESFDVESTFNTIPFRVEGHDLMIATTRPEMLFGCVALFVNPEDARYADYVGKTATAPLYEFPVPIMSDSRVSMEKGTGVVMCCTFGDTTDLEWYNQYSLPYKQVVCTDGTIAAHVPHIGGMQVLKARERMISLLRDRGILVKSEGILHSVSVHERCRRDIEIIPSRQWFIRIMDEKERFLEAADEINWYPASMKTRCRVWIENLKWDWCISRQRYFGVPIPVWYCRECGAAILPNDGDLPVNPLETPPPHPCECGCREYIPENSVLDTWATSSMTPQINARWRSGNERPGFLPMSMRTQAHEIIRTWAFYTIVKSLYHTGTIPWKDIMICGFVTANGEKISKSRNSGPYSPMALIEKHSADALRYWAANSKLGTDTQFSEQELNISGRFMTKLWNAARFCLTHLSGYNGEVPETRLPMDLWILERCHETVRRVRELLLQYEVGAARLEVDALFWKDFCDYYLEIVKDRLYKPEVHGYAARLSAQYAIRMSLLSILKLYAIYVPFITEEIYREVYTSEAEAESLHNTVWEPDRDLNHDILEFGEAFKAIVFEVRRYKSERRLSLKSEIHGLRICLERRFISLFKRNRRDLIACTGAKSITVLEGPLSVAIIHDESLVR
jgi:valyl-tRNA synthetase